MSRPSLRVAVVGWGKIAEEQHAPALAAEPEAELVAVVSRRGAGPAGVPVFPTLQALRRDGPEVDAVSLCGRPLGRREEALEALGAGWRVMLEKPPAATLAEVEMMRAAARAAGLTLFATWHSRFAPAVERARALLAGRRVDALEIDWREDVRRWHPGQAWIWEAGGFGVFDPGINGLSVATAILPVELAVASAVLETPANRTQPIAAELRFAGPGVPPEARATFDWRETGGERWQVRVRTGDDELLLTEGGAKLIWNGAPEPVRGPGEYPALYRRFVELVRAGASDVDVRPLRLVADAFLIGERRGAQPFHDHSASP